MFCGRKEFFRSGIFHFLSDLKYQVGVSVLLNVF